jgi:xylulokinase
MALLLGTDIGAQSLKVAIFDQTGAIRSFDQIPYSIERPRPGWAESDPDIWWNCFCRAVKTCMEREGIQKEKIESVGISNMCPSLVAMDQSGNPLRPAILYLDQRSLSQSAKIVKIVGEDRLFEITGNRVAPGTYSATSMLWIKEAEPDLFRKVRYFGHANTFLAHRLTGEFAFDWTNASFTGLFRTADDRNWSEDLCYALEIPRHLLPHPVISFHRIGYVHHDASRDTGLMSGTPVAIGGADTACSALGAAVIDPGQALETSGTSDVLCFCADRPLFDRRFMNRCHVIPDRWLLMGAMLSPGAALSWFRDQCCSEERQIAERLQISPYRIMDLQAEQSPPGARGILFLPYLQGERSPVWDPHARGVFFGLSLESTKGDMIRSILEGTAYGLRQNLEVAESELGLVASEIKSVGGGAKSLLWSQIKADILRRRITLLNYQETAVLGAAMLGALASGRYSNYREAVSQAAASSARVLIPNPRLEFFYARMYDSYVSLYLQLRELFERTSRIPPAP